MNNERAASVIRESVDTATTAAAAAAAAATVAPSAVLPAPAPAAAPLEPGPAPAASDAPADNESRRRKREHDDDARLRQEARHQPASSSAPSSSSASSASSSASYCADAAEVSEALFHSRAPAWLMTRAQLDELSPSRADGLTQAMESTIRRSTCEMVGEIGLRVLEKKACAATAMVLFNRFYSRRSLLKHDRMAVAVASLVVAGKATDFANAQRASFRLFVPEYLARVGHTEGPIAEKSELFFSTKEKLVQAERLVLFVLEYDVDVDLPFRHLQQACREMGVPDSSPLSVGAVRSANEALRTTLCVQYAARTLALGCLAYSRDKLADRGLLPRNPERWAEVVDLGGGRLGADELRAHRDAKADISRQIDAAVTLSKSFASGS